MSNTTKREYLASIRSRYLCASRKNKTLILDEFCRVCDYDRKYALRLLHTAPTKRSSRVGRPRQYDDPRIREVLERIWKTANLPCSKRLVALLPLWLPHYEKAHGVLPSVVYSALERISAPTIDRLFRPLRRRYAKHGLATTKPGSLLRKNIPIRTNQWDETQPGFLEADTVAHCGASLSGTFVYTVNTVDIATGWTEQRAVWGKGERGVLAALQHIEQSIPFRLRGFDSDNGTEFINYAIYHHYTQRKQPVSYTRSRPYHKNDNAHIEGKNYTHVREYLGYRRFDDPALVELLNALYTTEWRLLLNFFLPSVKLLDKQRVGSRIIKHHDKPKTPAQRLINSSHLPDYRKQQLNRLRATLNPFELQQAMVKKIKLIEQKVRTSST